MSTDHRPLPTQDHLVEALDYNPETGELRWKHRPQSHFRDLHSWSAWNGHFAGTLAGRVNRAQSGRDRLEVTIDWVRYPAARIIWKLQTGNNPQHEIDHEDGNSLNNRWVNLRDATSQQNKFNSKPKANRTGYPGVKKRGNKYYAIIRINGVKTTVGIFDHPEEAHEAYIGAANAIHGEFKKRY